MTFPRATLVGITKGIVAPRADLIPEHAGIEQELIELSAGDFVAYCARVSNPANQMTEFTYHKLVAYLKRARHWSPFEQSNAVIEVVTTRDIAHQILRHHSFRFQEFSQRYAAATKFHLSNARRQDDKNRQNSIDDLSENDKLWWLQAQERVMDVVAPIYNEALDRKIAKEVARKVLPEGLTETTMYMNGYLRSWIHYLAQRLDRSTQKEHRDVALACHRELCKHIPEIFSDADLPQE